MLNKPKMQVNRHGLGADGLAGRSLPPPGVHECVQEYDIELKHPAAADEPEGDRDRIAQSEQHDGHHAGDALVHAVTGASDKCRRVDEKAGAG